MKKRLIIVGFGIIMAIIIISGIVINNNQNKLKMRIEKIEMAAQNAIAKSDNEKLQKDSFIEELNKVIKEDYTLTTVDNGYVILLNESSAMYRVASNGTTNTVKWTTVIGQNKIIDENGKEYQIGDYIDYDPTIQDQSSQVVDFVKPIWELRSHITELYTENGTRITMKIRGTDTYFERSLLDKTLNVEDLNLKDVQDIFKVYVNGNQILTDVTVKVTEGTALTENRTIEGKTSTVQYGVEYTIEIEGFPLSSTQVKLVLPSGNLIDQYGNVNEETGYLVYSCLKATNTEKSGTSNFLGMPVQRNKIEKIYFVTSKDEVKGAQKYNVAAQEDYSIIGGFVDEDNNGKYEVYIGSNRRIYSNIDGSYLFANTAITSIDGLENLYVDNVSNMEYMFYGCNIITDLDLKTNFDTENVTKMNYMFAESGNLKTINLGNNFITNKVSNMEYMFNNCKNLTQLNLLDKFNTEKVTNMQYMFNGMSNLLTLSLGGEFNTSKVTNMKYMFSNCNTITHINLGEKFDTSSVLNMNGMFSSDIALNSLVLGDKFNTENVTNMDEMFSSLKRINNLELGKHFNTKSTISMNEMFANCLKLINLDLGPAFTKIASNHRNMFYNCGTSNTIIYCGEAIYSDVHNFRMNPNSNSLLNYDTGSINCKYRIVWSKVSAKYTTDKKLEIVIEAKGDNVKYQANTAILALNNFHIYIDGELADDGTNVKKTLSEPTEVTDGVRYTITLYDFEQDNRQNDKKFKEWSGNVSIKIDRRMALDENQVDNAYGNGNLIDEIKDEETNKNTVGTLFYDYTKPEFTYKYSNADINYTDKSLTFTFDAIDKYIDNSKNNLTLTDMKLSVYNYDENGNGSWEAVDINDSRNSVTSEIIDYGKRYTVVIKNLPQDIGEKYKKYSGYVMLTIAKDKISDLSGNKNNAQVITVGVNTPDGSDDDKEKVDVVNPTWQVDTSSITIYNKNKDNTLTESYVLFDITGTDKYYLKNTLTIDKIHIMSDGVEITNDVKLEFVKNAGETQIGVPLYENRDGENVQYGIKYHLKLSELQQEVKDEEKEYLEWSGYIELKVEKDTLEDESHNKNTENILELGKIDVIKPEIEQLGITEEENQNDKAKKQKTIKFKAVDKYLDTTAQDMTKKANDINVYVDGIKVDTIKKELTYKDITKVITNDEYTPQYVIREYTLVLKNFEVTRTTNNREREFIDYSGYVTVRIPKEFISDTSGNKTDETELIGGDVDYIKPTITYEHSANDINHDTQKYIMTIDITDRYFKEDTEITLNNISSIKIDGTELKTLANDGIVTIQLLEKELIKNIINGKEIVVGKRYELVLSNLQQSPNNGKDYSGVVTVAIKADSVYDKFNNSNNGMSITSGINIPGGNTGEEEIVDVVKPIWKRESLVVDTANGVATLKITGSDKYEVTEYVQKAIDDKKVRVLLDDVDKTENVRVTLESSVKSSDGNQIKIVVKISGFSEDTQNIYLYLPSGTLIDAHDNKNTATMFALLSCLKVAQDSTGKYESEPTSAFLGGKIQRKDIEKIVFEDNVRHRNEKTAWQVASGDSSQNEGSTWNGEPVVWDGQGKIYAWYNETSAPYTVHIGSDVAINANPNSSYLFANIGNGTSCKATTGIERIELLETENALNMNYMFYNFGYTKVTNLDLGDEFITENTTSMVGMFEGCGHNSMTTFNIGSSFDTTSVTNMKAMFKDFASVLAKLDLGDKFHINNCVNMQEMFMNCGINKMTEIDFGQYFIKIATENTDFATNVGKDGECTILIPESIYSSLNNFKLNATDETTVATNGLLNPIYRPEWIRIQSLYDNAQNPTKIILDVEGKTNTEIYSSNVTNSLKQSDLKVFVDDEEAPEIEAVLQPLQKDNQYRITIQGFEESVQKSGKRFLEWSGNVTVQFAKKTLIDELGNQNIERIQLKDSTWKVVGVEDETDKNKNEAGSMFIDIRKPEIKYKYSNVENTKNPIINYESKNVTVVFDVIDKYYKGTKFVEGKKLSNQNKKIKVKVDGTDITQQLEMNLSSEKIEDGQRYTLVLSKFELDKILPGDDYKKYSGPVQFIFDENLIFDYSGNGNAKTTLTIDYDDGDDEDNPIIVDVVDPIWSWEDSSIDRTNETVTLRINGSDKYLKQSTLTKKDITVLVDGKESGVTSSLATVKQLGGDNTTNVIYEIVLSNFGTECGLTQIKIARGTLEDNSENLSKETIINVGNPNWTEDGDDPNNRTYTAFNNSIVDFISPVIKYKYSQVGQYSNPSIDYESKQLTVTFDVIEKYFCINNLVEGENLANENKKVKIKVDGIDVTEQLKMNLSSVAISNGKRYTLVLSNFELSDILPGEEYKNYSGPVQLNFDEALIHDTSGNKNKKTSITIDYNEGNDEDNPVIVDVIDPIWKYKLSDINRTEKTVSMEIRGSDKYLTEASLTADNIKVLIDGKEISTITKEVNRSEPDMDSELTNYVIYVVKLGNFGENNGVTEIEIDENTLRDSSGNGNIRTKINVGNKNWREDDDTEGKFTAFKQGIVDFIKPEWTYVTSSIDRTKNIVEMQIKASDKYYLYDTLSKNVNGNNVFDTSDISVYVNNNEVSTITKKLELVSKNSTTVIYKLTLGNFGQYDGVTKISLKEGSIRDLSGNKNEETFINVGNPDWKDDEAFKDNVVDFIKPTAVYEFKKDQNLIINYDEKSVTIKMKVFDTNYLRTELLGSNVGIYVDRVENGVSTWTSVGTNIKREVSSTVLNNDENKQIGVEYTIKLSEFEVPMISGEAFTRYSGKFKLKIPKGTIVDTSGNLNDELEIVLCKDKDTDSISEATIIDFIDPKIYCTDNSVKYDHDTLTATVSFESSDRYFNTNVNETDESGNKIAVVERSEIRIYNDYNEDVTDSLDWTLSAPTLTSGGGFKYYATINNYMDEFMFTFVIKKGAIQDKNGRENQETSLTYMVDDLKPRWKYVSCDASVLDTNAYKMIVNVSAIDRYLNTEKSKLIASDLTLCKDGELISNGINITVEETSKVTEIPRSINYKITITGIKQIGTYSIIIRDANLIDMEGNTSVQTTMTFSRSQISSTRFAQVTYFVNDYKTYVNELLNIDTTGKNNAKNFTPSSLGELYIDSKNKYFAEDFAYANDLQTAKAFKAWAVTDEEGNYIYYKESSCINVSVTPTDYIKTYGIYEEIPCEVGQSIYLKAVWQDANVVFVSNKSGNDSNNGLSPSTAVKSISGAFNKLSSGTTGNRIIVIMDEVTWNSTATFNSKKATITSLYAGVDYKATKGAKLTVSSNISLGEDIVFDNIEINQTSTTVSDGTKNLTEYSLSNLLIGNYHNITLGREVSSANGKYTFGAIIGGNYKTESKTGDIGQYKVIVETGVYNDIIVRSSIASGSETTTAKFVNANAQIGSKKDATKAQNDKLTIKGYLMLGQNESAFYSNKCKKDTSTAGSETYANIELYSGTFKGEHLYRKTSEYAAVYLRQVESNLSDGVINYKMYGGLIYGNVYAGARTIQTGTGNTYTYMYLYGGKVIATGTTRADGAAIGGVFGQGSNQTFYGGSAITIGGICEIQGNVFGGSNATATSKGSGTANTRITIAGSSAKVTKGAIYGGSNGVANSNDTTTGYINGSTNVNIGSINANIYGGGYNCGVSGQTNVSIGGTVNGEIYGGGYQSYVGTTTNITITGNPRKNIYGGGESTAIATAGVGKKNESSWVAGTININFNSGTFSVKGNTVYKIYGGNKNIKLANDETLKENINITIGVLGSASKPSIYGEIYGGGVYDKINTAHITAIVNNIENDRGVTYGKLIIYGGSDMDNECEQSNIEIKGAVVDTIYGGEKVNGTIKNTNITFNSGTANNIYGGGNENSNVTKTTVKVTGGSVGNVYGAGLNGNANETNITISGAVVTDVYGGENNTNNSELITPKTNITMTSGNVTNIFGAGLNSGATQTNVKVSSGYITNIYGGVNTSGTVDNSNINITGGTVTNVYGGNLLGGDIKNTNVNIQGSTTITKDLYAGGYSSNVGTQNLNGNATLNITGGTMNSDVNGGSYLGVVYGETNVNIGKNCVTTDANSIVAGDINIQGDIYGAGTSEYSKYKNEYDNAEVSDYNFDNTKSVIGNTNIKLDGKNANVIFNRNIYGVGNASTYTGSSKVSIENWGKIDNIKELGSIQRISDLNIGNSWLELDGKIDVLNASTRQAFSLNRIDSVSVYEGAVIHVQSEFNLVKEFSSYEDKAKTKKATDESKVINRLYTLENLNLVFAKQEEDITEWGKVNGMTFFGLYAFNHENTSEAKTYDIYNPDDVKAGLADGTLFIEGAYVEGNKKQNHDITVDGFFTNVLSSNSTTIEKEIIDPAVETDEYYDWVVGIDMVNYRVTLVGSVYERQSIANLPLNYDYLPNATYTVSRISLNALKKGIELVDPNEVPEVANDSNVANSRFGLSMETTMEGHWTTVSSNNIYTADNGSVNKTGIDYVSDSSDAAPILKFKMYNSKDITRTQNLGRVNVVLIGKTVDEETQEIQTFMIIITVDLKTSVETENTKYITMFTDSDDVERNYTEDSKVDLRYHLFYNTDVSVYDDSSDYRALVSTMKLPSGTKLTLVDDSNSLNKVYYYKIKSDDGYDAMETDSNNQNRYIYKLNNFTEMGSVLDSIKYSDSANGNSNYYHSVQNSSGGNKSSDGDDVSSSYISENFYLTIDLEETTITSNLLGQDIHMELRYDNSIKFGQDEDNKRILNIWKDDTKKAQMNFNAGVTDTSNYVIIGEYDNTVNVKAALQGATMEDESYVMDTKYFDKIGGIAFEITSTDGTKITYPNIKEFYIEGKELGEVTRYNADMNGTIRLNVTNGYSSINKNYNIHIVSNRVQTGTYKLRMYYFYSDDGKYFSDESLIKGPSEFELKFVNTYEIGINVAQDNRNRIIKLEKNKLTDLAGTEDQLNMNIVLSGVKSSYTLRAEMYRRNTTYKDNKYENIGYSLVDLQDYTTEELLQVTNTSTSKEYQLLAQIPTEEYIYNFTMPIKKADSANNPIPDGEYKLVFKLYFENQCIQETSKTFVITQ